MKFKKTLMSMVVVAMMAIPVSSASASVIVYDSTAGIVSLDKGPTAIQGRIAAPAGATSDSNIVWNNDPQSVTLVKGATAIKGGIAAPPTTKPTLVQGSVSAGIIWDDTTKTVTVQ